MKVSLTRADMLLVRDTMARAAADEPARSEVIRSTVTQAMSRLGSGTETDVVIDVEDVSFMRDALSVYPQASVENDEASVWLCEKLDTALANSPELEASM